MTSSQLDISTTMCPGWPDAIKCNIEIKTREKETIELREENRMLNDKLVQYDHILKRYQEQLIEQQMINEKQLKVAEFHNILYPSIMISSVLVGTKLGPSLFKGGAIGLLIGTAVCSKYDDIADYVTKLIGGTKHEDL
jgi:hypothetical protein